MENENLDEKFYDVAQIVSMVAEITLFIFTIASLKYPRLTKYLTFFVTIDMVRHSMLRVHASEDEDQFRLLIILVLQSLF